MSLESATWATQLTASNPTPSDARSQGDDHLRMIKTVIKNELAHANREWVYTGHSVTRQSTTSFSVGDNQTSIYTLGRMVKVTGSSTGTAHGWVTSSTYSSTTNVNLRLNGSLANETLTVYASPLSRRSIPSTLKVTSADVTRSTTTLANDPDLASDYQGPCRIQARFLLTSSSATPDFKFQWVFSNITTPDGWMAVRTLNSGSVAETVAYAAIGDETTVQVPGSVVPLVVEIDGVVQLLSSNPSSGTVTLQWACAASGSTTMGVGSWMEVRS